jgi:hypothetical protein
MVKTLSKRWSSAKYDVIVKAKATSTRIVDINNEIVRLETNGKGQDQIFNINGHTNEICYTITWSKNTIKFELVETIF